MQRNKSKDNTESIRKEWGRDETLKIVKVTGGHAAQTRTPTIESISSNYLRLSKGRRSEKLRSEYRENATTKHCCSFGLKPQFVAARIPNLLFA
jgi:hypothetical protein